MGERQARKEPRQPPTTRRVRKRERFKVKKDLGASSRQRKIDITTRGSYLAKPLKPSKKKIYRQKKKKRGKIKNQWRSDKVKKQRRAELEPTVTMAFFTDSLYMINQRGFERNLVTNVRPGARARESLLPMNIPIFSLDPFDVHLQVKKNNPSSGRTSARITLQNMAVEEPFVMEHCRSALKCLEQLAGRVFTRSCVVSDDSGLVCGQLMAHSLMNIEGQFHHHQDQRRWCVGRCFCKPIVYAISVRRWKSYVSVGGVGHNRVGSRSKQTMPMIPYR